MNHADCVALCSNYCAAHASKCHASCVTHPEQYPNGLYRKLSNGKYEIISYCAIGDDAKPIVQHYVSIVDTDFQKVLDALTPKNGEQEAQ